MRDFLATFVRNNVFVNVLMAAILVSGGISWLMMVREMFPNISINTMIVTIAYPGADPEEVEEGISRKMEEAIDGIEGIKKYRTISAEGMATLAVEVQEGYPMPRLYRDISNQIDSISTFPVDAEEPIKTEPLIMTDVVSLALSGDQPERVLKEVAEDIKDELQALPTVTQVAIEGTRDYEIAIEVSEEVLRRYGLSLNDVARRVQQGSLNLFGGTVRTLGEEIRLRTVGRAYTGEDFADIVILAEDAGQIVTLNEVATIRDTFTEDRIVPRFNGAPAVLVNISKTSDEDALAIIDEVAAYVDRKSTLLPPGLELSMWSDRTAFINDRINLLLRNGLAGLILVFFSLWLFMDIRLSFWVMMGVPISLAGGLLLMWFAGSSINMMSLFGLIMVLGIVVDEAIIVGEAIYYHRRSGEGKLEAPVSGVMEVGLPVIAAVTTTIVAFMPLMFVDGVMGSFLSVLPVVVIAALLMSLVESMFILPAHLNHLPDLSPEVKEGAHWPARVRSKVTLTIDWVIERIYQPAIRTVVRFRYIAISTAVALLMITIGFVMGGFFKFILFGDIDGNDIVATIEFPAGTPLDITDDAVRETQAAMERVVARLPKKVDAEGREIPIAKNFYAITGVGQGATEFDRSQGNNMGSVRVEIVDSTDRLVSSQELLALWEEETGSIPGALAQTFTAQSPGPPGFPIEIALKGEDTNTLLAVSDVLKNRLRTFDGVYQVQDTYRPGKTEAQIALKPEARTLGLTLDDLARQVNAGFYGDEAIRLQRGRDDIRVKIRYTKDERSRLDSLDQVRIRTPLGNEVPFFTVADATFEKGASNIYRLDGQKSISVVAEVNQQKANADEVLAEIEAEDLPGLMAAYPGFTYSFEGAKKDAADAFNGLFIGFPLALFCIFAVIAAVFRSYIQPVVIMITIPFGIIGAVFGHYVMGSDIQMMSIFGMVALTGIVVNDSIVLIEAINNNIARGLPVLESIVHGGMRRFRAIILTSFTTVGGLFPILIETDAQAQFIIPMATSIAFGVIFATVLTLLFIPALLVVLNDLRRVAYWFFWLRWPTREEVEPARDRLVPVHSPPGTSEAVAVK